MHMVEDVEGRVSGVAEGEKLEDPMVNRNYDVSESAMAPFGIFTRTCLAE